MRTCVKSKVQVIPQHQNGETSLLVQVLRAFCHLSVIIAGYWNQQFYYHQQTRNASEVLFSLKVSPTTGEQGICE